MISGVKAQIQTLDEIERLEEAGMEALRNRFVHGRVESLLCSFMICFAGSSAQHWRPLIRHWVMLQAVSGLRWPGVTVWLTWEGMSYFFYLEVVWHQCSILGMLMELRQRLLFCNRIRDMLAHFSSGMVGHLIVDSLV